MRRADNREAGSTQRGERQRIYLVPGFFGFVNLGELKYFGHVNESAHMPPHYDWLTTSSGFTRERFEAVWADVMNFLFFPQPPPR